MTTLFRRKQTAIAALKFTLDTPLPSSVWLHLRKMGEGQWELYNRMHDTWIKLALDDWIDCTHEYNLHPITPGYFKENYEPI